MVLKNDEMELQEEEEEEKQMTEETTHESCPLSPVIVNSERTNSNKSTRQSRLSRISWSAKHSIALNQIESLDISSTYKRPDGVTIYVMDVYLRYFQTGIPSRKSDVSDKEKKRKAEYHVERRFSDFYQLRKQIKNTLISTQEDPHHLKWCPYCSRIDWLVSYGPFPPRCPMGFIDKFIFWKDMVVGQRRTGLTQFINRLVHLAKDSSYRYDREQCDGFVNICFILKDFVFEPSLFDHEAIAF